MLLVWIGVVKQEPELDNTQGKIFLSEVFTFIYEFTSKLYLNVYICITALSGAFKCLTLIT